MNLQFKKMGGMNIQNIRDYVRDYIKNHPDVIMHVGCDSKNERSKTVYAITICFQHPEHGVHIVFARERVNRIRDLFSRLWKEVEYVVNTAKYIKDDCGDKKITLHLDLNSIKIHGSNIAHDAGVGYCIANGFNVLAKPNAWGASYAADMFANM